MREDLRTKFEKAKPVLDAVFSGKSKGPSYLAAYIEHAARMPNRVLEDLLLGCSAFIGLFASLGSAAYFFLEGSWAEALGIIVAYPVLVACARWGLSRLRRPKTARDRREIAVRKAATAMKPYMRGRRLSKSIGQATAELLEESARNWSRATTALSDPFWSNEGLPAHWRDLRLHALEAVDDAMGNLIQLTQPYMKPINPKTDWQDVVGNVVGGLFGVSQEPDGEPLPPVFGTAREIAEKLKVLASQVEDATKQVIREQPEGETISSTTSLDACLSELKSIQQAEGELRQNLRN